MRRFLSSGLIGIIVIFAVALVALPARADTSATATAAAAIAFLQQNGDNMWAQLLVIVTALCAITGAASWFVAIVLTPLVRWTKNKTDDTVLAFVGRVVDALHAVLSRVAANPRAGTARGAADLVLDAAKWCSAKSLSVNEVKSLLRNILPVLLVAVVAVGCAGVQEQQPQQQRAGDSYGTQYPAITYNLTVSGTDSSVVTVSLGQSAQDVSQQGSAEQGQAATTGAVDNKPTVSPTISPTVSVTP